MRVSSIGFANECSRHFNSGRKFSLSLAIAVLLVFPAFANSAESGEQIARRACAPCHDLERFSLLNYDRGDWQLAVGAMVATGASLNKDEIPAVVDYLNNKFSGEKVAGVAVPGEVQAAITEWELTTPNSTPFDSFFTKRGGYTWYSGLSANVLGRFDSKSQKFEEIRLRPGSSPYGFVEHVGSGVQGTFYFTSRTGGFIGEFDPNTREVREFAIRGPKLLLHDIAFDPNGAVWFTATKARPPLFPGGSKIGTLSIFTSEIRLADIPTRNASPYSIASDSRGIVFFTEEDSPRLGSVYPTTMKVTEYALPNRDSGVKSLAITPDDMVWYTDYLRGYLGRFDPKTGKFSEWPSPSGPKSRPHAIASQGGVVWFAETGTKPNMMVRFDPKTEKFQSWPVPSGGGIKHIYAETDGTVWFSLPLSNRIARLATK